MIRTAPNCTGFCRLLDVSVVEYPQLHSSAEDISATVFKTEMKKVQISLNGDKTKLNKM